MTPGAKRAPIVPRKVEAIPGVCGTAMFYLERSAKLEAVLEALELTARPTSGGAELTIVATAEVRGVPMPWRFAVSPPGGAPQYVSVEALGNELRVQLGCMPPNGDAIELQVTQADLLKKHVVALTR